MLLNLSAQMTKPASGLILGERYDSTITFKQADYIVQGEVVFSKSSVVSFEPGARVFFMPGATLKINGSLTIKGEPNKLVQFSSAGGRESGNGLIITGNTPGSVVNISYASFKYLLKPLVFEKNWYRQSVDVSNSEFFNTYEFNDAVSIKEVEFYLNEKPLDFVFRNNVFADNYSNISVYNATSYKVRFLFEKNVFANNFYFDTRAKIESNPLYTYLDEIPGKFVMKVNDNAFADNFIFSQDSLKLLKSGTIGFLKPRADFDVSKNYSKDKEDKQLTQVQPNSQLHAFAMEVTSNGKVINPSLPIDSFVSRPLKVKLNTPLANEQKEYKVYFNAIDTASGDIIRTRLTQHFNLSAAGIFVDFNADSAALVGPIGYLSIENLKNPDGLTVPSINLGILDFFRKLSLINFKKQYVTLTPIDTNYYRRFRFDSTQVFLPDSTRYGKWEVGLFGGISGYAGDLNHNWFRQDKYYIDYGLKIRYHYNRNISLRFNLDYTTVGCRDYGQFAHRKLSFKSNIISATLMAEYEFLDKYKRNAQQFVSSLGHKIYPSIGVGIGLVNFNPKAQYTDGTWYALRQFGTEGQTAPGGKKYSTITLSVPVMGSLNYRVNNSLKVALEFTAFKLFTDYLDDVSQYKYVDKNIIAAANPSNPEIATYFLNPGRRMGTRGNPKNKDFIYNVGLSVWYRFHHKHRHDEGDENTLRTR